MIKNVVKASWIIGALFVLGALLSKLFNLDIIGVRYNINYFHAANTALLFGILFSLRRQG